MLPKEVLSEVKAMKAKSFKEVSLEMGPKKFRNVMCHMYSVLGMSTVAIGNLLNKSDVTIADWLRRLGIGVKSHRYKVYARLGRREEWRLETVNGEKVKTHIIVPDKSLIRLIFFAIGDGSIGNYMMQIHQANKSLFPILLDRMRRYGRVFVDYYSTDGGNATKLENACKYRLTLNRSEIARLIFSHGNLRFDTIRFSLADIRLAACAIASFWDADGSILVDRTKALGFRAEITQTHVPEAGKDAIMLLTEIKRSLKNHWGIQSKLRSINLLSLSEKQIHGRKIKTKKPQYILHIVQSDLLKFAKKIGIHLEHPGKKERILKIIKRANARSRRKLQKEAEC